MKTIRNLNYNSLAITTLATLSIVSLLLISWLFSAGGPGFSGSQSYSAIAQYILENGKFESAFRPPLYPLFLASMMKIFGSSWVTGAVFFQVVFSLITVLILVRAAFQLTDHSVAALLVIVLYATNVLYQIEVLAKRETSLFTLLVVFIFCAPILIKSIDVRYIAMAIAIGLAFLTRPNAVIFIPLLGLLFVYDSFIAKRGPSFKAISVGLLLFLALIIPWQTFVYRQTGKISLTPSTTSGQTLWKGNNPYFLDVWPMVDLDYLEPYIATSIGVDNITLPQSEALTKLNAKRFITENPLLVAKFAIIKMVAFFSPMPIPFGKADVVVTDEKATLQNFKWRDKKIFALATFHSCIIWFGWFCFLKMAVRNPDYRIKQYRYGTIAMAVLLCAVHTLTSPESRYRLPLDVVLTLFSGIGWAWFSSLHTRKSGTVSGKN